MRVLFINPPNNPFTQKSLLIEPIDILTVATYIQSLGHTVKVIDMDVKRMYPQSIEEIYQAFVPDAAVILFDYHIPLHTSDAAHGIYKIINILKQNGAKVVISGKTSKHYPELFLNKGADAVIRGEAEPVLEELLNMDAWINDTLINIKGISYKDNEQVITTPTETAKFDLNKLPVVDRDLIDLTDYIDIRSILSSRGCNGGCGFCATPDYWGKWRAREARHVVDEIQYLVNKLNAKKIMFLDDNATVDKDRMKEISLEIIKRGIDVMMGCLGSIPTYDRETLQIMYRAGFRWIHYGIETGSQELLRSQGKYFDIEYAKKVIKETKEIGLRVRTSFIMDLPGVDESAVQKTIDFILETEPDEIRLHYLSIRVGTKLYKDFENVGWLPSQYIHSDKPVNIENEHTREAVLKGVEALIFKLRGKGYLIIKEASGFKDFDSLSKGLNNLRFVSFCPSLYGVNWRNAV